MSPETKDARPNILFIMTDQQRFDQIGYASDGFFETPNLDKLAKSGIIFDNAYTVNTVCVPTRGSLMTGLYPHRFPTQGGAGMCLQEGYWTVPRMLQQEGYQTALIGKMHFYPIHSQHGFEKMRTAEHLHTYGPPAYDDYTRYLMWQGKADWKSTGIYGKPATQFDDELQEHSRNKTAAVFGYDEEHHHTAWIKRETIDFLENRDTERPYFLITSFPAPHTPYDPPEPYASMYDQDEMPLPEDHDWEANDDLPAEAKRLVEERSGFGYWRAAEATEEVQRRVLTYIRAMIKHVDDAVGEILEHVDLTKTVVMFSTDHGDYSGHRGLFFKSPFMPFEDLARVPFFVAGAGVPQGKRLPDLVQNFDIAATALELGVPGKPIPPIFDAQSLTKFFENEADVEPRTVYTSSQHQYQAMRKGSLKYFLHVPTGEEMLFDLDADPGETKNLIDAPPCAKALAELRETMRDTLRRGIPHLPRIGPAVTEAPEY